MGLSGCGCIVHATEEASCPIQKLGVQLGSGCGCIVHATEEGSCPIQKLGVQLGMFTETAY